MTLRSMQIFLPGDEEDTMAKILEDHEVFAHWQDSQNGERVVVHLLVSAEQAEPIMDQLQEAFSDRDDYRVILQAVEAILPLPDPEDEDGDGTPDESGESASRVSRGELYAEISESFGIDRVYLSMTVLATFVAAVGLLRDDVAVIIGAMVIAPLLSPNVAMSLATTLGDMPLLRRSALTNGLGLAVVCGLAFLIGTVFEVPVDVPAIASRTQVGLSDIVLALAAGSAGTFAFTRGLSGAVVGVMVAVALIPPLVAFGMLLGAGHYPAAGGAFGLIAVNIVCINLAGIGTFLAQGVRPRTVWEEDRARKAIWVAVLTWTVLLAALAFLFYWTEVAWRP